MTRSNLTFLIGCILLLLIIADISQSSDTPGEQSTATAAVHDLAADFEDKIVLLEVSRSSTAFETKSGSLSIAKVRFAKFGNRDFIIGTGYVPKDGSDFWYKDMLVGVPCDSILRFVAMREDQMADYVKKWKEDGYADED